MHATTVTRVYASGRLLLELGLAQLLASAAIRGSAPSSPSEIAVALSAAAVLVGAALAAPRPAPRGARFADVARHATELGTGVAVLVVANTAPAIDAALTARAAAATVVLSVAAAGLARWIRGLTRCAEPARLAVLATLALAGAAPVWLGPAVERLGGAETAVNGVIAASPLTYVAVMCGFDYLRSPGIYMASPIGSLRFEYPHVAGATAAYVALAVCCLWFERPRRERSI